MVTQGHERTNATELFTLKCLILCYVNFTTIKIIAIGVPQSEPWHIDKLYKMGNGFFSWVFAEQESCRLGEVVLGRCLVNSKSLWIIC